VYTLLKYVPNAWMTAYGLAWNNAFRLLTSGNFYVQKITNGKGDTIALMPLNPWTVTVRTIGLELGHCSHILNGYDEETG
jgi:phage portal protein BeeE